MKKLNEVIAYSYLVTAIGSIIAMALVFMQMY